MKNNQRRILSKLAAFGAYCCAYYATLEVVTDPGWLFTFGAFSGVFYSLGFNIANAKFPEENDSDL